MKTSARNVFKGQISKVRQGAVNAEVTLRLSGGEELVAIVTQESVDNLPLNGAIALVKAPWVVLMTEADDIRLSARNTLKGKVASITEGAVNAKVMVELSGGSKVTSIITREAVSELELIIGKSVLVIIKASHIILGVPA